VQKRGRHRRDTWPRNSNAAWAAHAQNTAAGAESSPPALGGKIFLITGANRGIGYEVALELVLRGARVLLACRDTARGAAAARELSRLAAASARAEPISIDLASLSSVRRAAEAIVRNYPPLDVVIDNAGVMALTRGSTEDGFETNFGTNHLGHFALNGLLLPHMAPGGRFVTVSSVLHAQGGRALDSMLEGRGPGGREAYSASKLANLLFAYELDRRLREAGATLRSSACHPGYTRTARPARDAFLYGSHAALMLSRFAKALLGQPAARGAWPVLYAAIAEDVQGGDYVGPAAWFGMRGRPALARSSPESRDRERARRLWSTSERLTSVTYPFDRVP
jgi:protochlorophyllide reductase